MTATVAFNELNLNFAIQTYMRSLKFIILQFSNMLSSRWLCYFEQELVKWIDYFQQDRNIFKVVRTDPEKKK